jgi:hypothetical protein
MRTKKGGGSRAHSARYGNGSPGVEYDCKWKYRCKVIRRVYKRGDGAVSATGVGVPLRWVLWRRTGTGPVPTNRERRKQFESPPYLVSC